MITLEKLKVYREYRGDCDGWARRTGGEDVSGITGEDWRLIDELRQKLALATTGMAAAEFVRKAEARLLDNTADDAVRQAIRELARSR